MFITRDSNEIVAFESFFYDKSKELWEPCSAVIASVRHRGFWNDDYGSDEIMKLATDISELKVKK